MDIYEVLKQLNISYKEFTHEKAYTVDQMKAIHLPTEAIGCKNLFLTDGKGTFFLIILEESKKVDFKKLKMGKHLSFAKEEQLKEILHLTKGSVTPFGLMYDKKNVNVLLDSDLQGKQVLFHPNRNDRSLEIKMDDLLTFLNFTKHTYEWVEI